jgi:hypothetical protein
MRGSIRIKATSLPWISPQSFKDDFRFIDARHSRDIVFIKCGSVSRVELFSPFRYRVGLRQIILIKEPLVVS